MGNRKAKNVIRAVFGKEGLRWDECQEHNWENNVKSNHFKGCKVVSDYLSKISLTVGRSHESRRYLTEEERQEVKARYKNYYLPW